MAHYLLSGVAGFIAARVAELLLEAGHTVIGVDDLNDAYDVRMKHWRLAQIEANYANFYFHDLDISDREAVKNLQVRLNDQINTAKLEAVINLAARAGVRYSVENPWIYVATNITGTLNLLDLSRHLGISKFILASTSSIYGANAPLPTPEDAESSRPLQPYAASKKGAEVLCHSYHYLYGIDVTIFRYFTVYGPAGRPDMVMFRFAQWINEGRTLKVFGDGEQTRGFTYIDDIAKGTILGLRPLGYEIINLGGHETISVNNLVDMFEKLTGKKALIERLPKHPADMLANWANVEKAGRLLGWEPLVSLEQGVANLLAWYEAERDWACLIETT
jgi:nucleoside-diphosphate-sugar epimerase